MENIIKKLFVIVILTIANVNLVSAMAEASKALAGEATVEPIRAEGTTFHVIDDHAVRDKHVATMYEFARHKTFTPEELTLARRQAKTEAMFGDLMRKGSKVVATGTVRSKSAGGAEESKS